MRGEAFNVGDNSMNYTKRQIALKVKEFIEFYLHEAEVGEDFDKRDYEVSYDKIQQFGYKAKVDLGEGIEELKVELKYNEGEPVISEIMRVSKPGRRVYSPVRDLPTVANGLGVAILSLSKTGEFLYYNF